MSTDLMAMQYASQLPENRRMEFSMAYAARKKDRTTAFLLSLFLGGLGVDRMYVGDVALGVLKMVTLGGCFFWAFIDLFLIMGAVDQKNTAELQSLYAFYSGQYPRLSQ